MESFWGFLTLIWNHFYCIGVFWKYNYPPTCRCLKGPINPGEHLLAFGTQKPENFNDKNRIYLAFWCVFKDIEHYFHEFVCFKKKIFLEFVCFPRFQNSINDPRKHPNLAKNRKFCQNHQTTTNVGFCDNSFDQIFRYDPKVHCLWIFWS